MKRTYYIAFLRGIPSGPCCNCHSADTVIVQARRNKDYLSPDIFEYFGEYEITKKQLRENVAKPEFLAYVNRQFKRDFQRVVVE